MAITTETKTTSAGTTTSYVDSSTAGAKTASNPNAILSKDSFMKLLLVELQHQDPTAPMDSDKILTQTSQLATLESQENTNKVMTDLAAQMKSNMNMGALDTIGKMASLGSNSVSLVKDKVSKFEVYFENEIKTGTLTITDKNNKAVKTVSLTDQAGKSGVLAFQWDGTDNGGATLAAGNYSVTADYVDAAGKSQTTQFGIYPVESIKYDAGKTLVKLGSSYLDMSYVKEFF